MENLKYRSAIDKVNLMYKEFNADHLLEIFDDEITLSSEWVLNPLKGKNNVYEFLKAKMKTLKHAVESNRLKLMTDIAILRNDKIDFILMVHAIDNGDDEISAIQIHLTDNQSKIKKINISKIRTILTYKTNE